jgi:purine-nucleoside phosphorylase
MTTIDESVRLSAERLCAAANSLVPRLGIVLGSGWDAVAELVESPIDIAYRELPAFPVLGVQGHLGSLRLGRIGGQPVAVLRGRKHAYETGDASAMKGALRTLAAAGCRALLLTNAAGSLAPAMRPGELMLIADHLNIVQRSPLHGEAGNERFVDLGNAYDTGLREQAKAVAAREGIGLHEGIYAWVLGPQFETPAEIRMLQLLGAQAVGMSTVPETILARHAGMKVLAVSMFTNMGCGMDDAALSHAHTLSEANRAAADALRLLQALIPALEIPA